MLLTYQVLDEIEGAVAADGRSKALVGLLRWLIPLVHSSKHLVLYQEPLEHVFQHWVLSVWPWNQVLYCIFNRYSGLRADVDEHTVGEYAIRTLL